MSAEKMVLITDYAWPNVVREREILGRVGASIIVANTGDEDELVQLAPCSPTPRPACLVNVAEVVGALGVVLGIALYNAH